MFLLSMSDMTHEQMATNHQYKRKITSAALPLIPNSGRRKTIRNANPQPINIPSACFMMLVVDLTADV
jgi:hypothetical protein